MLRKSLSAVIAGLLTAAMVAGVAPVSVSAVTSLTIPENYATLLDLRAVKWSDTDSTGHKAGAVVATPIEGIGTLICYYVPDDYKPLADKAVTRTAGKETYYFVIGYAPGGPVEYKRGMAAILCSTDEVPKGEGRAIFVEDLQDKFGEAAATTLTATSKPTPPPASTPATSAATYADAEFAAEVIRLINAEREKAGVKPLTIDDKLCEIAGLKAKEMVDLKYFDHTSPNYGNPRMFAKHYGYDNYSGVGENIYRAVNAKPQEIINWWLNSPSHKKNMLNSMYTKVGFGGSGNLFYALELAKK